jgi:hypothetical protein
MKNDKDIGDVNTGNVNTGDIVYRGSSKSRSDTNLFIATESGLLEIPISQIESIEPISEMHSDLISVKVKTSKDVKLRRNAAVDSSSLKKIFSDNAIFKDAFAGGFYTDSKCNGVADDCLDYIEL